MDRFLRGMACATMASAFLSGCGTAGVNWEKIDAGNVPDREVAVSQAKDAVRGVLKDPDSAQFRNAGQFFKTLYNVGLSAVGEPETLWALCIEVNSKNSYGAYTGYQNWLVKFRNGYAVSGDQSVMHAEQECQSGPMHYGRRVPG
jgi:hypothetical protein